MMIIFHYILFLGGRNAKAEAVIYGFGFLKIAKTI